MGSKRKLSIVRYSRSQQVTDKIVIICDNYFLKKNYFKVKMDFVFSDIIKKRVIFDVLERALFGTTVTINPTALYK